MAEALRDLLGLDAPSDAADLEFLEYLESLSLESVLSSEPQALAQISQSMLRSIQALSKRSHKYMVNSAIRHSSLQETIRDLDLRACELTATVPRLDAEAERFSRSLSKSGGSQILAQRKEALHLLENSERIVDLLELPALLLSAVTASPLGYSTSLDLYGHIRRLSSLYPESELVRSVRLQADDAIRQLAIDLITSLTTPNLKLAAALRTTGWLKRIVPELVPDLPAGDSLPAVFLICRFSNLITTLEALNPLRELADEERRRQHSAGQSWSGGQQTERFLKRFIEVFREHSFNIISISKNAGVANPSKSSHHFVSGLGSGMSTAIILQPLDLLKTRVQQSGQPTLYKSWLELRRSPNQLRALWRGTLPSAIRTGFGSALYFSSLNAIRQYAARSNVPGTGQGGMAGSTALPKLSNTANLLSGAVARTLAGVVLMPLTVIKVRFESSLYSYPSLFSAVKDIKGREGFRGFFSGVGATAMRDAPYAGLTSSNSDAKTVMGTPLAGSINFGSAILAGAACSVVSNPFDAVKTRIQLQPQNYRNMGQAWYKMITEDGFRSLWSGLGLRMGRKALSSALAWTLYEELIRRYGSL
ncbi:mitochondrial carrier protein, putative [Cordyceps militaris CM01]|uniref:Mitochondrial glycine transporter n=1 Tax=Cordyceps militaris (strain CM01) TaxID=983644 RepID=G3JN88_CORMM|nr:mitochondrial carrier protein, putative [Cordyceps militaris CM01]EGX90270.1 mitochondrial carrier protein, putative [Cordyceps militaris CM01]